MLGVVGGGGGGVTGRRWLGSEDIVCEQSGSSVRFGVVTQASAVR